MTVNEVINTLAKDETNPEINKKAIVELGKAINSGTSRKFVYEDGEDIPTALLNEMNVGDFIDTDIGLYLVNSKSDTDIHLIRINANEDDAEVNMMHYYGSSEEWSFDEHYYYPIVAGTKLYRHSIVITGDASGYQLEITENGIIKQTTYEGTNNLIIYSSLSHNLDELPGGLSQLISDAVSMYFGNVLVSKVNNMLYRNALDIVSFSSSLLIAIAVKSYTNITSVVDTVTPL